MKTISILNRDLQRRNTLFSLTMIVGCMFGLFVTLLQYFQEHTFNPIITGTMMVSFMIMLIVFYLNQQGRHTQIIPYIGISIAILIEFLFLLSAKRSVVFLITFVVIISITIYMRRIFSIIGYLLGFVGLISFLPRFGIGPDDQRVEFIFHLAYFIACCIMLFFLERLNRFFHADLRELQRQTDRLNEELAVKNEQLLALNRFKDEILANTSHELRTPINGIIGLAESLNDGVAGELPDEAKTNLDLIITCGKRLGNLVNDILDYAKMRDNELELNHQPISIEPAIQHTIDLLANLVRSRNVLLINLVQNKGPYEGKWPLIRADENRFLQVLHNLLANAIKFTEQGSITFMAQQSGEMLEISIQDSGIGIPHDKLASIFDSFEQVDSSIERNYGGTGLGLAITKKLIELHGGSIRAESELGKWTRITFTMPIHQD